MGANMVILPELERMDQSIAVRTLRPLPFRHVFTPVMSAQAGFAEYAHGSGKLLAKAKHDGKRRVAMRLATAMEHDNPHLKDLFGKANI